MNQDEHGEDLLEEKEQFMLSSELIEDLTQKNKSSVDAILTIWKNERIESEALLEYISNQADIRWLLFFAQSLIERWIQIPWSPHLKSIMESAHGIKTIYRLHLQVELEEQVLDDLTSFFRAMDASGFYQNDTDAMEEMWYFFLNTWDTEQAIKIFTQAMTIGSEKAYFSLGIFFLENWDPAKATEIFTKWFEVFRNPTFLTHKIRSLSLENKRSEAYELYKKVTKKGNEFSEDKTQFLMYSWKVTCDDDLRELETIMQWYQNSETFTITSRLKDICDNAMIYIANEVSKETHTIDSLGIIKVDGVEGLKELIASVWDEIDDTEIRKGHPPKESKWSIERDTLVRDAVKRRLFLMQIAILTLWQDGYIDDDTGYVDLYLDEIRKYGISTNSDHQAMMLEFFADNFSLSVVANYNRDQKDKEGYISTHENGVKLKEAIKLHIIEIAERFSTFSLYHILAEKISPLMMACIDSIPDETGNDISDTDSEESSVIMKAQEKIEAEYRDFERMSPLITGMYDHFIEEIDLQLGVYYRRDIQYLARDLSYVPETIKGNYEKYLSMTNNQIFSRNIALLELLHQTENPSVLFLYLMENIIVNPKDITKWFRNTEDFFRSYGFDNYHIIQKLIFLGFIYEYTCEHVLVMELVDEYPELLQVPYVLCVFTEVLRYADDEECEEILARLDLIAKKVPSNTEDQKGFFELLDSIAIDAQNETEDIGFAIYGSAALWHTAIIHDDVEKAQGIFTWIVDKFPSDPYPMLCSAEVYHQNDEFEEAIALYERVYLAHPDMQVARILINCCIEWKFYEKASLFIGMALRDGYDITNQTVSYYIEIWDFDKAISIMKGNIDQKLTSEGAIFPDSAREKYIKYLNKALNNRLKNPSDSCKVLKILYYYMTYIFDETDLLEWDELETPIYILEQGLKRFWKERFQQQFVTDFTESIDLHWLLDFSNCSLEEVFFIYVNFYCERIYMVLTWFLNDELQELQIMKNGSPESQERNTEKIKLLQETIENRKEHINIFINRIIAFFTPFIGDAGFVAKWRGEFFVERGNEKVEISSSSVIVEENPTLQ